MKELRDRYEDLYRKIVEARNILDLEDERAKLLDLEKKSLEESFWDNPDAKNVMKNISDLRTHIEDWDEIYNKVKDSKEILEVTKESEHDIVKELEDNIGLLEKKYSKLENQIFLGEKYDKSNAIFSIYSGAGGDDAQDWSEMLLRMYLRYAEKFGFEAKIVHIASGDQAGIKSVTVEVSGLYAFGYLKNERGVHRLVRLSPFDSDHARHTSFALVEIYPELEEKEFSIDEKDLKIETFRASGHGGQSVNTTDSAVRITHLPTGLTASCQNERSQLQNKAFALKMLISKLKVLEEEEKKKEAEEIRGETISAEWGNQIRSYVLHPYNMVKDLRTGFETANTQAVLDGEIADFIDANLKLVKRIEDKG